MRNTSGAIVLSVAIPLVLTLALAPPPSFARGGGGGASHSSSGMSSAVGLAHPSLSSRAGAPAADPGVNLTQAPVPGTSGSPAADSALHANGAKTPGAAPDSDAAIDAENRRLDRSVDSICRGC
jgi:hypothetical protein